MYAEGAEQLLQTDRYLTAKQRNPLNSAEDATTGPRVKTLSKTLDASLMVKPRPRPSTIVAEDRAARGQKEMIIMKLTASFFCS